CLLGRKTVSTGGHSNVMVTVAHVAALPSVVPAASLGARFLLRGFYPRQGSGDANAAHKTIADKKGQEAWPFSTDQYLTSGNFRSG
ncbi:hypothetical protein, partial [Xanthomonas translucens]